MKFTKISIFLVLSLIICSMLAISVSATNERGITFEATLSEDVLSVSESNQTVQVTIKASEKVPFCSIGGKVKLPAGFTIKEISNGAKTFTSDDFDPNGTLYFMTSDFEDVTLDTVMVITLNIPANTPAGTYEIGVDDLQLADFYGMNLWEDGTNLVVSATLTIKDVPACDHANTKLVSNVDGKTHSVVCTNEACNGYVVKTEDCSGTDDGDCTTAVNCACGNVVTAAKAAHEDAENDGDHKCDACDYIFTDACSGGTATCTEKAICSECGEQYGNFANHEYMYPCDQYCCICYELTNPNATHSIIHVEAKPGTDCETYDGNIEYWYCEHCRVAWTDEECTNMINMVNVKVAGEHTYTYDCDTNCKVCEQLTRPEAKHEGGTATCVAKAVCQYCETAYGELAKCTSLTPINGQDATCKESGWKEYWKCFTCNTLYADSDATKKIDDFAAWKSEGGEGYIAVDPDNHTEELEYSCGDVFEHFVYYPCCLEYLPSEKHSADENGYCVCGAFAVVQDFNGGKVNPECPDESITPEQWALLVEQQFGGFDATEWVAFGEPGKGFVPADVTPESFAFMNTMIIKEGYKIVGIAYDKDGTQPYNGESITEPATLYLIWACNHDQDVYEYTYTDNRDGTHTVMCACGETIDKAEEHDYTTGTSAHTCACGVVEKFTLTVRVRATGELVDLTVPYGANLLEVLAAAAEDEKIPALGEIIRVNNADQNGENSPFQYSYSVGEGDDLYWVAIDETTTMPAEDFEIDQDHNQIGWVFSDLGDGRVGAEYCDFEDGWLGSGWHYIEENYDGVEGGAWYYFAEGTGEWEGWFFRVEGLTRVPYPTSPINGVTYKADANALDYCDKKGKTFIDAEEAWFLFGEDGKFLYDETGMGDYNDATRYMVNGMLKWHPGLLELADGIYYFIGDETNGGNIAANGIIYLSYTNGIEGFETGKPYSFVDGKLNALHGIVEGEDGKLHYYIHGQLQMGTGLTLIDENGVYIYVRSNGELAVGEYYVGDAKYVFGEDGKANGVRNGVIDGVYYVNGHVAYGAGLIEWEGDVYYVRSNGQVATGTYYVTNIANYEGSLQVVKGMKLTFGADGKLAETVKNGVVDGVYYVNNSVAYGAGLIEWNGDIYYVRSNGQVATGKYYITVTNGMEGYAVGQKLFFGEDGKLITE